MKVVIPSSAKKGFIDIWFKLVPAKSDPIVVYKVDDSHNHSELIHKQYVYGSGNPSGVTEHYLLKIPCNKMDRLVLTPGDTVEIMTENQSGDLVPLENEIIEIK